MSVVTEILTIDQLHELWGAGFTIAPRKRGDPFDLDQKLIPRGMTYQWNPIKEPDPDVVVPDGDWKPVPYSRHEGVFAPWGTPGDIQLSGLQLMEKPTADVVAFHEKSHAKAQQNVEDWLAKTGASFSGGVNIGGDTKLVGDKALAREITGIDPLANAVALRSDTKTIETTVGIPKDMAPHINAIFKERDRLEGEVVMKNRTLKPGPIADKFYAAVEADPGAPWWPTLRAILLPIAVDNVRAALKKEKTDD